MSPEQVYAVAIGHPPAGHQQVAWQHLSQGRAIILRAPTGSGKTEAVVLPFLTYGGSALPARLLYTLPLRALAKQMIQRVETYARKVGKPPTWRARLQHGEAPESVLFAAEAIVATIDQAITAYACAPLTLPVRHGNIPAGAVTGSFLVFDEIHLFDPELALQAARLICERLHRLGIPYAVLSATLPDSVLDFWHHQLGAEPVETPSEPWTRTVSVHWQSACLDPTAVLAALEEEKRRILAVCNTVDRAIALFQAVRPEAEARGYRCNLLHARFLPEDRLTKEQWVLEHFGKEAPAETKALLVATQVVEVGLDISCDCLLTEIAPVDALVQRAGRCARWGGHGEVQVFAVERSAPYEQDLVAKTQAVLQADTGAALTWERVKTWVNRVLNERYHAILSGNRLYEEVIARLSRAAFEGSCSLAAATVRDIDTVEVTVHSQPHILDLASLRLPTISVHRGLVRQWIQTADRAWRIDIDADQAPDARPAVRLVAVGADEIRLGDRLILPSTALAYSAELGLHPGSGQDFTPRKSTPASSLPSGLRREPWIAHTQKTIEALRHLLTIERHALTALARWLAFDEQTVQHAAELAALFHDLGKLSLEWQQRAGITHAPASDLLAHTDGRNYIHFPPHATVSAYALWPALIESAALPRVLARAVVFAVAHHHSVRAKGVPPYRLHPAWREACERSARACGLSLTVPLDRVVVEQSSQTDLRDRFPPLEHDRLYTTYILIARWLRLADRIATGGEDAVLRYENWFGGL